MYYSIRHVTRFKYTAPVCESVMELRMQPRSDGAQRCYSFEIGVQPRARIHSHRDALGNFVHHFDVPENHRELVITAEAMVFIEPPVLPERLGEYDWKALNPDLLPADAFEMLLPSHFARPSPLLGDLAARIGAQRRADPLSLVKELNTAIFNAFEYAPNSTKVDSPIEHALETGKGVCQDYAHIFITLLRAMSIPARYVSGYLHHSAGTNDRSSEGATHAWVEAWLPGPGWIGLDPTNNLLAGERHIRVAVGRDYADVPPTRGVFRGEAGSRLAVSVVVRPSEILPPEHVLIPEQLLNNISVSPPLDPFQDQQQQQ